MMQPRRNYLPWILGCLALLIICGLCTAVALGLGLIAWLQPVRSNSGPLPELSTPALITAQPLSTLPAVVTVPPGTSSSLTPLIVSDVKVEIGVGSGIPVEVLVSSEWPSPCAQLAETNIHYLDGQQIQVELLATTGTSGCATSQEGLPFNLRIPLNPVELPTGKYSLLVNGVKADMDWSNSPSDPAGHYPTGAGPDQPGLVPVRVDDVTVEIGVGSPIPVDVVITAGWPSLCSQLVHVKTDLVDRQFKIDLQTSPSDVTCSPDLVGLVYPVRIPLNMSGLPAGSYTVTVIDKSTSFDWPPSTNP